MEGKYGTCSSCNSKLKPEWFIEAERKNGIKTGRVKNAVSYLVCETCLKIFTVDDSFDEDWRYQR